LDIFDHKALSNFFLYVIGGHLISMNIPPRKSGGLLALLLEWEVEGKIILPLLLDLII
jgi:hypothetical protein